jgi:replication factor C small subunit
MNEITLLEKYTPKSFGDLVGQTQIIEILQGYVRSGNIPHMMFVGNSGIGKTATTNVIAKELFGDIWRKNLIMLNASSDRGIDIIRGQVKDATQYAPLAGHKYKIIFMDEADFMTEQAQRALRETMIRHQSITRFIFAVNDISKMITPLQDRCQVFRFKSLSHDEIKTHIMKIAKAEEINIKSQNLMLVAVLAKGSMRKAINAMQSLSVLPEITEPIIRELMDTVVDSDHSKRLLKRVLSEDVEKYEEYLFKLVYANAFNPSEILHGIMNELMALNEPSTLSAILTLAEHDWRISQGANSMIQTRCAFFRINQMKNKEKILAVIK